MRRLLPTSKKTHQPRTANNRFPSQHPYIRTARISPSLQMCFIFTHSLSSAHDAQLVTSYRADACGTQRSCQGPPFSYLQASRGNPATNSFERRTHEAGGELDPVGQMTWQCPARPNQLPTSLVRPRNPAIVRTSYNTTRQQTSPSSHLLPLFYGLLLEASLSRPGPSAYPDEQLQTGSRRTDRSPGSACY